MRTVSCFRHVDSNLSQNETLRGELAHKSKACLNYESQLHRVQNQMLEELDGKERDIDRLRAETEKLKVYIHTYMYIRCILLL